MDAGVGRRQSSGFASNAVAAIANVLQPYSSQRASCRKGQLARRGLSYQSPHGPADPAFPAARRSPVFCLSDDGGHKSPRDMSPDKPSRHRDPAVLARHIPPPPAVALPSVVKRTVHAGQVDDDESNPSPLSPDVHQ